MRSITNLLLAFFLVASSAHANVLMDLKAGNVAAQDLSVHITEQLYSKVSPQSNSVQTECQETTHSLSNDESFQLAQSGCCRICRTGKACGNSCINRSLTCHQPPGCACNG